MAKKILVVEDVDDSRSILVVILQRFCGYETVEAATGTEAVEKAVSERPDLIMMDLGLPDMNGVDVAEALKENPSTVDIPIVAHTAWTVSRWRDAAFNVGMVEYLEKPVSKEVIKATLAKFIQP
jgi:CheY-like chemotaxis protein